MTWVNWLLIGTGGFCGAIMRYTIGVWIGRKFASVFPYGTLAVNVIGSFALGCLLGSALLDGGLPRIHTFTISLLGAFTTFSAYAAESLQLLRARRLKLFAAYQAVSYSAAVSAAALGWFIGRWIAL